MADDTSEDLEQKTYSNDGIYVLRTTQQNQVQLTLMADQKANIVIGVSLIFFTLAQRQLVNGIGENVVFIVPFLMLALTMLASFLLAIAVLVPRIRSRPACAAADLPNPLFFGFFPSAQEDDYVCHLAAKMADVDSARELLIRDIYQTGRVLRRKFRFLRLSYLCLATGVVSSGAATAWLYLESMSDL